jgi:hypothetical protein
MVLALDDDVRRSPRIAATQRHRRLDDPPRRRSRSRSATAAGRRDGPPAPRKSGGSGAGSKAGPRPGRTKGGAGRRWLPPARRTHACRCSRAGRPLKGSPPSRWRATGPRAVAAARAAADRRRAPASRTSPKAGILEIGQGRPGREPRRPARRYRGLPHGAVPDGLGAGRRMLLRSARASGSPRSSSSWPDYPRGSLTARSRAATAGDPPGRGRVRGHDRGVQGRTRRCSTSRSRFWTFSSLCRIRSWVPAGRASCGPQPDRAPGADARRGRPAPRRGAL